jgi:hypothetical protein
MFAGGSAFAMRRAFYLNKWVHATDPDVKQMIAGFVNLTASQKDAAQLWLQHYKSVPKRLAYIPLTFIVIETMRAGYAKVKSFWKV